jgi:dTDP-4-dehydrorhamnose reductase
LKSLVLGAGGQLGSELVKLLGPDSAVSHRDLDITNARDVQVLIDRRRPDVVFNCAAYNAVDRAETDDEAFAVNALGPLHIAQACRTSGASFVHFSTNFVFDGTSDEPYVEADQPAPQSKYAKSKFDGEMTALSVAGHFLVIRTAAVYGGSRGFPHRILERARSGEPLRVVSDQRVNPTYAKDLAAVAAELARNGVGGVVHAVAEGCCGWDELARAALAEAGIDRPVESVPTGAYPAPARRPRNGCLASTRIPPLRPWRAALHEALNP